MKPLLALLTTILLAFSADAQPSPSHDRWRSNLIEFFFYQNGTEEGLYKNAFTEAMGRWNVDSVNMRLVGGAADNVACRVRAPGVRIINWVDFVATPPGTCGKFKADDLAVTFTIQNEQSEIVAADIFFKADGSFLWSIYDGPLQERIDFRRVAVHEIGHAAGLNLTPPNGEDRHDRDPSSIMFGTITNNFLPSAQNLADLRAKYVVALPPSPPGEPSYRCLREIPYKPVVEMNTVVSTTYLLKQCLDRDQFSTNYYFTLNNPRQARITIAGENGGKRVDLVYNNGSIWRESDGGNSTKSITRLFEAGRYQLQISNGATSGSFTGVIDLNP